MTLLDFTLNSIRLKNIEYFAFSNQGKTSAYLDCNTFIWIASAEFDINNPLTFNPVTISYDTGKSKQLNNQKAAVRQLLYQIIKTARLNTDIDNIMLDETKYPYRLKPNGYFVSFSHSRNRVACALCRNKSIGIDIELNPVPLSIAKRFYSANEIDWINSLEVHSKQTAINLLWMLKEATIKRDIDKNLMTGLTKDLKTTAEQLLIPTNTNTLNSQISLNTGDNDDLPTPHSASAFKHVYSAYGLYLYLNVSNTKIVVVV